MSVQYLLAAQAVDAYTLTTGRLVGTAASLIALAGVIIGGLALSRRAGTRRAVVSLTAGAAGMIVGGVVVAAADGGPGTGYGIVGGFVALVVGLVAVLLGGLALARSRHAQHATTS